MRQLTEEEVRDRQEALLAVPLRTSQAELLMRHWLEIAGSSLIPSREDLDPARMKAALPHMVIHRVEAPDRITIRLAGTEFYQTYNKDLTGQNYLDLVEPDRRRQASARLHAVVERPCGLLATLVFLSDAGTRGRSESFGLPLIGQNGVIDTIIYTNVRLPLEDTEAHPETSIQALNAESLAFVDIGAGVPERMP